MKLHEKLYQLRKKKGITQAELSEELNVSRQSISNWEVGTVTPTIKRLQELSYLYNVPLDYLLNEDKEEYLPIEQLSEAKNITTNLTSDVIQRKYRLKWILAITIVIVVILVSFGLFMIISSVSNRNVNEEVLLNEMKNENVDRSSKNNFDFEDFE